MQGKLNLYVITLDKDKLFSSIENGRSLSYQDLLKKLNSLQVNFYFSRNKALQQAISIFDNEEQPVAIAHLSGEYTGILDSHWTSIDFFSYKISDQITTKKERDIKERDIYDWESTLKTFSSSYVISSIEDKQELSQYKLQCDENNLVFSSETFNELYLQRFPVRFDTQEQALDYIKSKNHTERNMTLFKLTYASDIDNIRFKIISLDSCSESDILYFVAKTLDIAKVKDYNNNCPRYSPALFHSVFFERFDADAQFNTLFKAQMHYSKNKSLHSSHAVVKIDITFDSECIAYIVNDISTAFKINRRAYGGLYRENQAYEINQADDEDQTSSEPGYPSRKGT